MMHTVHTEEAGANAHDAHDIVQAIATKHAASAAPQMQSKEHPKAGNTIFCELSTIPSDYLASPSSTATMCFRPIEAASSHAL